MTVVAASRPALRRTPAPRPADTPAECLCDEHHALAGELPLLDQVADEIGAVSADALLGDVYRVYDLVAKRVIPHMAAERVLHARLAERDRRHLDVDHEIAETRELVGRLAGLKTSLARGDRGAPGDIRHVLYALHALTRLHFADELRFCDDGRHAVSESR